MPDLLPLLVTGTVLSPGGQLPMRLDDGDGLRLVSDLVQNQDLRCPEFGVVARCPDQRTLFSVGTVARLVVVTAEDEDHRYAALALGGQRFHLDRLTAEPKARYPVAEVTCLDEPDGPGGPEIVADLAECVRTTLTDHLDSIGWSARLSDDPWLLSHEVGAALRLDLRDRQRLLGCPDTAVRLGLARSLVTRERRFVQTFGAVPFRPEAIRHLN